MKIKSQKDFYSGVMFTAVGTAFAVGATNYKLGDAARMGPGYFPMMVGVLLAIGGLIVIFGSLTVETRDGEPVGKIAWKPLFLIISANLVFGLLLGGLRWMDLPAMGLVPAIYALVIVASMAGSVFSFKSSVILATLLAIGSYLTFVIGLNLQFQVWPRFITG